MDAQISRLLEFTSLPTAAGHEERVVAWIDAWVAERPDLECRRDSAGNLTIGRTGTLDETGPEVLYFTAHLDHPAFVLESKRDDGHWNATFRGGVRDPYFVDAALQFFDADDTVVAGRVVSTEDTKPIRSVVISFDDDSALTAGDIGRWTFPDAELDTDGRVHTHACDDLAAGLAALEALDVLRQEDAGRWTRIIFTRAEEVGFVGATAACRLGTMPIDARVLALENSRSFPESPIGAGPIVRVGDKASTFSPTLTAAVTATATELAKREGGFDFQRKLMSGGTCEATVFCEYGYASTCVCLPLGNYHNMGELDAFERDNPDRATPLRETIAATDYYGLIDLLIACGRSMHNTAPVRAMVDRRHDDLEWVLHEALQPRGA